MTKSTHTHHRFIAQVADSDGDWVDLPSTKSSEATACRKALKDAYMTGCQHRILRVVTDTVVVKDEIWREELTEIDLENEYTLNKELRRVLPEKGFQYCVVARTGERLSLVASFSQEGYARDYARFLSTERARAGITLYVCDRDRNPSPVVEVRST